MNKSDDKPAPLAALTDKEGIDYLMRVYLRVQGRASALASPHLVPMVRKANEVFKKLAKKDASVAMLRLDLQRHEAFEEYRTTTLKNLQTEKQQRAADRGGDNVSVSDLSEPEAKGDAPRLPERPEESELRFMEPDLQLEEDSVLGKRLRAESRLSETLEARSRSG